MGRIQILSCAQNDAVSRILILEDISGGRIGVYCVCVRKIYAILVGQSITSTTCDRNPCCAEMGAWEPGRPGHLLCHVWHLG